MIGDVRVTIVDIRGEKVRVGIEAPKDVPVHRLEVYEAIQRARAACCICGSQNELKTVPPIASNNANGRKWCMACFTIWYDEGVTDSDEILKRRQAQDVVPTVSKVGNAVIEVPMPAKPELKWGGEDAQGQK